MEIAQLAYGIIVFKFAARSVYARASITCNKDKSKTNAIHARNYHLTECQQVYKDCSMTGAEKTPRKDICQKNPIMYVLADNTRYCALQTEVVKRTYRHVRAFICVSRDTR